MQFCCIGRGVIERNREELKGFQHMGRKIKGLWQGCGDLSFLSSFLYLQLLHAHISALLCKGSIPLHFIKQLHFTLLWFLGFKEPQGKEGEKAGLGERWKIL